MAYFNIGKGYDGSPELMTTDKSNYEVLTHGESVIEPNKYSNLIEFSFMNNEDCKVIINHDKTIYLRAYQGFNAKYYHKSIDSFVIIEEGITFNWIGATL